MVNQLMRILAVYSENITMHKHSVEKEQIDF